MNEIERHDHMGGRSMEAQYDPGGEPVTDPQAARRKLSELLEIARSRKAMSKKTLAGRCQLGKTTVSHAFNAKRPAPSIETLTALDEVLKIGLGRLLELREAALPAGSGPAHRTAGETGQAREMQLGVRGSRPAAEVDAPPGLDYIPYRKVFVGRSTELDQLDTALATPGEVVIQAVHGLGGIGKSSLAAQWAATHARAYGYAPIRWITADNPTTIEQSLANFATVLQPDLATMGLSTQLLADRATQWLATHTNWLIILDNVNEIQDIADLLGCAATGRFLITSRLAFPWHDAATVIRLGVMDEAESLALLTRIASAHGTRNMDGAPELCAELGYLPLAVEQAAAYLAQNELLTPRGYLDLLAQYPADMYKKGGAGVTDSERTIARIWRLTLDRIHQSQPLATDLLRTLSWYAPDQIPVSLCNDAADALVATDAIGLLTAYNMAATDPTTNTLAVHRLVQALARTSDPTDPHRTPELIGRSLRQATARLRGVLPATWQDPAMWQDWRTLMPHIDALVNHAPAAADTEDALDVLNEAGKFLINQGSAHRAKAYLTRALDAAVQILGRDHPYTLSVRTNLGGAYEASGDVNGAILVLEQTLKDRARVLPEDHPDVLAARNNLAFAYEAAGNFFLARPLMEQALNDASRLLGNDDATTMLLRNNLACVYRSLGDVDRAIGLLTQTLHHRARVLGEDHPDTLVTRHDLARTHQAAGDLDRAVPLLEQSLRDRTRILGKDHPHTLTSHSDLANAYETAGDLDRAIPLLEQTLDDAVRVFGNDHPNTLTSRVNLAYAYQAAGSVELAVTLLEQTLDDAARALGEDHPITLSTRNILANACLDEDPARAITLHEQTLKGRMRVLGQDHPDTLTTRNNIAHAVLGAGDPARAAFLLEQALNDAEHALGNAHPVTSTIRTNLAFARSRIDI
ncbi:tetratricopeptide repeat protein [Streptomyces mirabilis]|uniref:tetratricopeptide repeat protein n=1 Tax=Streptomyces mirabilis TaxID=68239 RepID=UPI0036E0EA94